ncbi:hypothetical protein ACMHYB_61935 [Sorangium sp. So ce1128]
MMGYRDIESPRGAGFVPDSPRRPERPRRVPAGRGCGARRRRRVVDPARADAAARLSGS